MSAGVPRNKVCGPACAAVIATRDVNIMIKLPAPRRAVASCREMDGGYQGESSG